MKSILNILSISGALIIGSFAFQSCKQDVCSSVVCANNGSCNSDGSCTCPTGYEGERCETVSRDKFKGSWNVLEDGTLSNPASYTVSVQNGTTIDQVSIRNFNNFANSIVEAKVLMDTIHIPQQTIVQDGVSKTVIGKGYFVQESFYGLHGKLVLKYKVTDAANNVNSYGYLGAGTPSEWVK